MGIIQSFYLGRIGKNRPRDQNIEDTKKFGTKIVLVKSSTG